MTIEYLNGIGSVQVEHVDAGDLHLWTAEHPQAVIVHAIPDPRPTD